jgi:putative addiction module component (TIGR02574 family)
VLRTWTSIRFERRWLKRSKRATSGIERANLAGSLLRSLDPSPDPLADQAWAAEIERRVQAIDRGEVNLTPWDEVMAAMRTRRNG